MLTAGPKIHTIGPLGVQYLAALQVLQVRQHFENGEAVMEWRKRPVPKLLGDLTGGAGAAIHQRYDAGTALGMVLLSFADPFAVTRKGRAMRGQDEIHLQTGDAIERGKKLPQGVPARLPSDVGGDVLEDVVARD